MPEDETEATKRRRTQIVDLLDNHYEELMDLVREKRHLKRSSTYQRMLAEADVEKELEGN